MEILATRTRVTGTLPQYEYRLLVPFDELPAERQRLIHYRTNFGKAGGPYARLTEVIAPIDYLRMEPGLARFDVGRTIASVAKRLEAKLIAALYPEMTAPIVPILFLAAEELDDAMIFTRTQELVGRFDWIASMIGELDASGFGLSLLEPRWAA